MSRVGDIAKGVFDLITPDGETSRLTFRKFDGQALSNIANGTQQSLGKNDVVVVNLKINPSEIAHSIPKITQKIQTSAPGRFVVFDWGTDLRSLGISGNTGNMLPGILQSGFNPMKGVIDDVVSKIDPVGAASIGTPLSAEAIGVAQNLMLGHMSYHEIINMSPKYRIFKKLEDLYETFDADMDVLTLEMGDVVYRGFFTDFSFTQTADSPWNWKYTITFIALANLSVGERRGDARFSRDNVENE